MDKKALNVIVLCIFAVVLFSMRAVNEKNKDSIYNQGYSAGCEAGYEQAKAEVMADAEAKAEEIIADHVKTVANGIRKSLFDEDYPLLMDYETYMDSYRWQEYIGDITEDDYYYNLGIAFEEKVIPEVNSVKDYLNEIINYPLDYFADWNNDLP